MHESGGATANFTGTLTAQFDGLNPEQALALLLAGDQRTFQGLLTLTDGTSPVPEPTTTTLVVLGITLVLAKRYKH